MTGSDDTALEKARAALKNSERLTEPNKTHQHSTEETAERSASNENWRKASSAANAFWSGWAQPVAGFLAPVTRRIGKFYAWAFAAFAHTGPMDARRFSGNRAVFVTIALIALTLAAPYVLIVHGVPFVSRTLYDAGMLASMKEDALYLGRAELIDERRDLFQVMGCRDISGCDGGDNTTYYRLRPNVILNVQYWTTRFEPYDPAEIAGAMVSELNDCTIRYYGRRVKALGWYPYIVSASCTPA